MDSDVVITFTAPDRCRDCGLTPAEQGFWTNRLQSDGRCIACYRAMHPQFQPIDWNDLGASERGLIVERVVTLFSRLTTCHDCIMQRASHSPDWSETVFYCPRHVRINRADARLRAILTGSTITESWRGHKREVQ